jgi:hypothetical protein
MSTVPILAGGMLRSALEARKAGGRAAALAQLGEAASAHPDHAPVMLELPTSCAMPAGWRRRKPLFPAPPNSGPAGDGRWSGWR